MSHRGKEKSEHTSTRTLSRRIWLAGGNSLREVFAQADALFFLVAPIRALHLAAVVTALVFMFLPAANDYFRRASSASKATQ